jgi:hypothetical protein
MEGPTKTLYKNHLIKFHKAFGKQIEDEFGLKWIEGGIIPNYSRDEPSFYAYRRATLEEARALVLAVIFKLSEAVQSDPEMLSYLNKSSFTLDFLGVDIIFESSNNQSYDDGSIDRVHSYYSKDDISGIKKLQLEYEATDPFADYSDYKNSVNWRMKESFEDAVKLNAISTIANPAIHYPKEFEDELNQILTSFKDEMKGYSLYFRSIGWMKAGNPTSEITEIRTKCTYYYPIEFQEARELMLLTAEKLLSALNNSETLKPFLKNYPFSTSGIKLKMLFRKSKHLVGDVTYSDGSLESAVLSENTITYYKPNKTSVDKAIYAIESVQEAQQIFENSPPVSLFQKAIKQIIHFILDSIYFLKLVFIYFFFFVLFMIASGVGVIIIAFFLLLKIIRRYKLSKHSKHE